MSEGWRRVRLRRAAEVKLGKMLQTEPVSKTDVLVPYVSAIAIQEDGLRQGALKSMWSNPPEQRLLRLLHDDVVVVEGGSVGRSTLAGELPEGTIFQNSVNRVRASRELATGPYINYALQDLVSSGIAEAACNKATILHLTAEKLAALEINLPSVEVQQRLVTYLDRETAEIDAFIADQEELIALLTERRAATISHTTKAGLPQTPANWTVTAVKHVADLLPGYAFSSETFTHDGSGRRLLRGVNVGVAEIVWSDVVGYAGSEAVERYELREGDVVVGMDRPIISGGTRVAEISREDAGALLVQRVLRVRGRTIATPFIAFALSGVEFRAHIEPEFTGVSVPHMSESQVGGFRIAVPPANEVAEIIDRLDHETAEIDAAIADAREAIALSKERRAALISAAVTGKIDVTRGAAA